MAGNSNKTIIRVQKNKENPYVMIRKGVFQDRRLSWKAKGLMGYFLSKPDDWQIIISDLIKQSTDGRDSVYAGLKELRTYGYVEYIESRDKGKIVGYEYIVHEEPLEPHTENPDTEKPLTENPTLLNTEITYKTHQQNTDNNNKPVAVVQKQIESHLGTSVSSLLPLLAAWLNEYGEETLINTARYIGNNRKQWDNIIGAYRVAITTGWSVNETTATAEKDHRYEQFYQLFPDS